MIQMAEDIAYLESRKVPLDPRLERVLIEVAATQRIDFAIVDETKIKEFNDATFGDEVAGIDWVENTRGHDLIYDVPKDRRRRFLLLWNANDKKEATVAYKISPLE